MSSTLSDDIRYVKLVLLLVKGGTYVCKKHTLQILDNDNTTIDKYLEMHKDQIYNAFKKKVINKNIWELLCPDSRQPKDVDVWDISAHAYFLLNLFNTKLTDSEEVAVKSLREMRNDLAHSGDSSLAEATFLGKWSRLALMLFQLSIKLTDNDKSYVNSLINDISAIQHLINATYELKPFENSDGFIKDVLEEKHRSYERRLDEYLRRICELEEFKRNILSGHLDIIFRITASASTQTACDAAHHQLLEAAKQCLTCGHANQDNDEVSTAINNVITDMSKEGASLKKVEEGSVLIVFSCSTWTSLKNVFLYLTKPLYIQRHQELEKALSQSVSCCVKLNVNIVLESLISALDKAEKQMEQERHVKELGEKDDAYKKVTDELYETKRLKKEIQQLLEDKQKEIGNLGEQLQQKDDAYKQQTDQLHGVQTENEKLRGELQQVKEERLKTQEDYDKELPDKSEELNEVRVINRALTSDITRHHEETQRQTKDYQIQLQEKIDEINRLNDELGETTASLNEQLSKLADETNEKINQLQKELQEKDDALETATEELQNFRMTFEQLKEELQCSQAQTEEKQKTYEDNIKQLKDNTEELNHVKIVNAALTKELKQKEDDMTCLKGTFDSLLNDNNSLLEKLDQKDDEINQLKKIAEECEGKNERLRNLLAETDGILKTTAEKLEWQEKDVEQYKIEIDRVKDLNTILQDEISSLKNEIEQNQVRIVEYKNTYRDLEKKDGLNTEEMSNLKREMVTLKAKLYDDNKGEDFTLTVNVFEEKMREMSEENETQRQTIENQNTNMIHMNQQIFVLSGENERLNNCLQELNGELDSLKQAVDERTEQLTVEKRNVEETYGQLMDSETERQELFEQLNRLKTENSALKDSISIQNETTETMKKDMCQLKLDIESVENTKKEIQDTNARITGELEKFRRGHAYLHNMKDENELSLKTKDEELTKLKESLQAKSSEIVILNENTGRLELELSKTYETCKGLQSKVSRIENECEVKQKSVYELESNVKELNATVARLHEQLNDKLVELSKCNECCQQLKRTISNLREECSTGEQRLDELNSTIQELNGTIARQHIQLTDMSAGHNQLIAAHDTLIGELSRQDQHVRSLEEQLRTAQDDLNHHKESYKYCVEFRQRIHASRLNQERDDSFSFHQTLPEESFMDELRKENLELKDSYANSTLECSHLAFGKQELSEQIKQLRTQLYGCQERLFDLQRQEQIRRQMTLDD